MSYPPPPSGPDDPAGQQNPYGPPEGSPDSPDSPGGPSGAPPPQPPYGGTSQPPYGQPTPSQPPGLGQPAYGQPGYGQPPTAGQPPAYGQPPGYGQLYEKPPSQALAIWALVLACIPCLITNLVSIVLAVLVLTGKRAGRVLAIIALAVNALVIVGWSALIVLGVAFGSAAVDDLETGQCFTATGLNDGGDEGVSDISVVECSESHDAEVLGTNVLDAEEAAGYEEATADEVCGPLIPAEAQSAITDDLTVTALTQSTSPSEGDLLACVVHSREDVRLNGSLR